MLDDPARKNLLEILTFELENPALERQRKGPAQHQIRRHHRQFDLATFVRRARGAGRRRKIAESKWRVLRRIAARRIIDQIGEPIGKAGSRVAALADARAKPKVILR